MPKNQQIGMPREIGDHGDFVIVRKVIITENGEQREFYLPDGTFLGQIQREEGGEGRGTAYKGGETR